MVRSLWTAATGMNGQQSNLDAISNNLSNVNTTGFKQQRVEFEDLVYQNVKLAGTPATEDTVSPVGIQQELELRLLQPREFFLRVHCRILELIQMLLLLVTVFLEFSSMTEATLIHATALLRLT